ncbi:FCD domain-containing protein [Thiohalocapsa marina]|uniref:FCD domain-containing protein n=1 Tax=Thiohalocapsa marina TaxID=424902 RepID=A0A5M8FFL6_9GAMM|nr:FCD domain-containing protein [Thiohalocapsa marina]KAA6183184.1 FCD domain-containing protein [Thiohalocapsa marina]
MADGSIWPADTAAPKTLTDIAYARLRADIIGGRHPADAKLRVEHLRRDYGLGATPLREALSRLTSEGFVVTVGQRGFRVAPVSVEDLDDITDMRITLELKALRQSLERGDDAWESRVVAAYYQLSKAETGEEFDFAAWEERNRAFHETLISACASPWLMRFHAILYDQHKRYRNISLQTAAPVPRDVHQEHQRIYQAALARDADTLCTETQSHIRRTADITRAVLLVR